MCCRLTIFLVYNAYPERSKTETWEKRLTCISWMFGCYKTMIQQVEGQASLLLPPYFTSHCTQANATDKGILPSSYQL